MRTITLFLGVLLLAGRLCGETRGLKAGANDSLFVLDGVTAAPADSIFTRWDKAEAERWKDKPANRDTLEAAISALLHFYSQYGYPFAEASPTVEQTEEGKFKLRVSVIPGPAVYVARIFCPSFSAGEQRQLARLMDFSPGWFDERAVARFEKKVGQFSELVWSGEPKLVEAPDFSSARLDLPVSRRGKNRVEGGLGYLPSGTGKGAFGTLALQLASLGRFGREVDFSWERPAANTRLLSLEYRELFLVPAALYVLGNLRQEERAADFFRFAADCGVSARTGRGWRLGGSFGYERITPQLDGATGPPAGAAARLFWTGLETGRGDKDRREQGYFSLAVRLAYKKIFDGGRTAAGMTQRVEIGATRNFPLGRNWSCFLQGEGAAQLAPAFLFTRSDLFYLGGPGSLRGYPEASLSATRFLVARMEPRFNLTAKDFLFAFLDFGYLPIGSNVPGLAASNRFKPGTGLGLSAGDGRARITIGWGEKARLKDGIVYLRLSGEL